MISNPNIRKWIYAIAAGVGAALVALGVVDANVSNQVLAIIGGLLTAGVGGLALPNTPAKATPADVIAARAEQAAADARSVVTQVQTQAAGAVEQARRELECRLGQG